MSNPRVVFRVEPQSGEDVFGYLTRVANANALGGLGEILEAVLGCKQSSVTPTDISALAYFCRLYPDEFATLSGISMRTSAGTRAWQVHQQWVTKEPFVASRQSKVCPQCLRESAYARGEWGLTFYTTCTRHRTTLIERCPACDKYLKWNRRSIAYCSCGCDLADVASAESSRQSLLVAALIEGQCGLDGFFSPPCGLAPNVHRNLAALSLDGLCKTLWFVGHCLSEQEKCATGHGRYKPSLSDAEIIIWKAVGVFEGWPHRMGELLTQQCTSHPMSRGRGSLVERLLGPLESYLGEELQEDQFRFVTAAYEKYVNEILRAFGRQHRRREYDRQEEFDFEQS